jgi:hypothetical protein
LEIALRSCHKHGLKAMGWIRLQNHGERIAGKGPLDAFYVEHPQFLEKNIDGMPIPGKLCLGYPEVREFHVKIAEEAMDLGADGIMIETLRHLPKVAHGDPVVEEFQKRHGLDMRRLPPFDPRVVEMQVDVMTGFLREVREAVRKKKKDAELHMRVCKAYPLMGCDPGRWAREGLLEALLIENRSRATSPDIPGLVEVCKGTACRPGAVFARPKWGNEKMPLHPDRIQIEVAKYLRAGAQSIVFYESAPGAVNHIEFNRAIRRINHPEELPSRIL